MAEVAGLALRALTGVVKEGEECTEAEEDDLLEREWRGGVLGGVRLLRFEEEADEYVDAEVNVVDIDNSSHSDRLSCED
jgi:hypothetical protein